MAALSWARVLHFALLRNATSCYDAALARISPMNFPRQQRPRRKTATVSFRFDPDVKAAAERAAAQERRSLTGLIEVLILEHCKRLRIPVGSSSSRGATP